MTETVVEDIVERLFSKLAPTAVGRRVGEFGALAGEAGVGFAA